MRVFLAVLSGVLVIGVCGAIAMFAAGLLAEFGYLGSCFEGGCGYAAVFFAFPLIWACLSVVGLILLWRFFPKRPGPPPARVEPGFGKPRGKADP